MPRQSRLKARYERKGLCWLRVPEWQNPLSPGSHDNRNASQPSSKETEGSHFNHKQEAVKENRKWGQVIKPTAVSTTSSKHPTPNGSINFPNSTTNWISSTQKMTLGVVSSWNHYTLAENLSPHECKTLFCILLPVVYWCSLFNLNMSNYWLTSRQYITPPPQMFMFSILFWSYL